MEKPASILLVDDDLQSVRSTGEWLQGLGYNIDSARSCRDALEWINRKYYDMAIIDVRLSDGDGFDLLKKCKVANANMAVIMISAFGTAQIAMQAIRDGAIDFLTKPLNNTELRMTVQRALRQQTVKEDKAATETQLDMRFGLDNIVGHDARMRKIYEMINSIANTRATVLITGESGTGKSMIARTIHRQSSRANKPFVELACGALPETLLESELFGHVAGAFTGATGDKIGKFRQADGGTIFLDEIATASMGMQVKLLRVLQDFEFEPVGGAQTFTVNTRVILATNDDLSKAVAAGRFRQDLYYRVNVINIELPPLRERVEDIPLLAAHFLESVCKETGKQVDGFSDNALDAMKTYTWPGNVRELENAIERAVLLGKDSIINADDLPTTVSGITHTNVSAFSPVQTNKRIGPEIRTLKEALAEPERQIILEALKVFNWNRLDTANALGINRTTLYKKMKRLGLEEPRILGYNGIY